MRSLPVRQPERLVELLYKYPRDPRLNMYPWKYYEQYRDENHVFADLVAVSASPVPVPARSSVSARSCR